MLEDPRIVKRSASDAHARATGFIEHLLCRLRRGDITIADDGNGFHSFDDSADSGEVDYATKPLFARPAMNKNRGDADVFKRTRQIR